MKLEWNYKTKNLYKALYFKNLRVFGEGIIRDNDYANF